MPESVLGAVWLPILPNELEQLEAILNKADVVVRGNYRDAGVLSLADYISASKLDSVEFRAIFDRNLISPLVQLASGKRLTGDRESLKVGRLACASLAFCIWADILVEPSMALYEFASSTDNESAQSEFTSFRIADNVDPRAYLNIALGLADRLPCADLSELACNKEVVEPPSRESNFVKRLTMWRPNYLYVLKTVELIRSSPTSVAAAIALMQWQAKETFYNAAATVYCLAAISHNPPKGGMLKSSRSNNVEAIQKGIRNATWDICLVQQFGRYVAVDNSPSWSLWSNDIALRSIARNLFVDENASANSHLERYLKECWGKDGRVLLKAYREHSAQTYLNTAQRRVLTELAFRRIDQDIEELESRLGLYES